METSTSSFDWALFWQAASAISTSIAVIVALWQTTYNNKKKIKITFRDNVINITDPLKCPYVELEIVNVGNRKIVINRYGMIYRGNFWVFAVPDETDMMELSKSIELDVEQYTVLKWKKSDFLTQVNNLCAISVNSRIMLFVQDTTGAIYTCKTSDKRKKYLDEYKTFCAE